MWTVQIDPLVVAGVVLATAMTDGLYAAFTTAAVARRRVPARTCSGIWCLLASFAVISTPTTGCTCCSQLPVRGLAPACR